MKGPATRQAAILLTLVFGWAAVAGGRNIPVLVTSRRRIRCTATRHQRDPHAKRGEHLGDRLGQRDRRADNQHRRTYLTAPTRFPATAGINNVTGAWTFLGGVGYIAATTHGQPNIAADGQRGRGSASTPPYIGGASNAAYSEINFDSLLSVVPSSAPARCRATAAIGQPPRSPAAGTRLPELQHHGVRPDPRRDLGRQRFTGVPTGYGFDNTLLAAFYVSPSTAGVAFTGPDPIHVAPNPVYPISFVPAARRRQPRR